MCNDIKKFNIDVTIQDNFTYNYRDHTLTANVDSVLMVNTPMKKGDRIQFNQPLDELTELLNTAVDILKEGHSEEISLSRFNKIEKLITKIKGFKR